MLKPRSSSHETLGAKKLRVVRSDEVASGDEGHGAGAEPSLPQPPKRKRRNAGHVDILGHLAKHIAQHVNNLGRVYAERYTVTCAKHTNCTKSRAVTLDEEEFGKDGWKDFLGAWLANKPGKPQGEHSGWTPSVAEIRSFLDACRCE